METLQDNEPKQQQTPSRKNSGGFNTGQASHQILIQLSCVSSPEEETEEKGEKPHNMSSWSIY